MPNKADHLITHVRKHFPNKKVAFAYEAGPTGYGLYEGLAAQAYRCVIASPAMIPQAPGQRVKTNRLDSRKLAESPAGRITQTYLRAVGAVPGVAPSDPATRCVGQ